MKILYLIKSMEDGFYKVGISKHPQKRLKQLQTGNSSELKIIQTFNSPKTKEIEVILHNRYSHLRKEGEWFEFTLQEEVMFIDECKKIEKYLIELDKWNNDKLNIV